MTPSASQPRPLRVLVPGLVFLYAAFLLLGIGRGLDDRLQWDFKSHYCAAQVHELGLNFYVEPYLRHFCSPDASQYYSYTPLSIWFFRFFSLFPYGTAYGLFFGLKVLALAALLLLWMRHFLEEEADPGFYLFILLAFNGALYLDLRAGNVSLFEQAGLWLGFFFLLKKKPALFGLCVVLAASFKVVPLAFLGLLLFLGGRKKLLHLGGSLLAFLGLQALSFALNPTLFKDFLRVFFTMLREVRGITNPSMFVWVQDALNSAAGTFFGRPAPPSVVYGAFVLLAALVVFLTWKALTRISKRTGRETDKAALFLFCLAYALIMPRFKDYSYILLLVPAYHALKKHAAGLGRVFLFGLAALSVAGNTSLPGFEVVFRYVWDYFPLLTAVVFWVLSLRSAFNFHEAASPSSSAT